MKIGLITVYFGLFDEALPPTFRQERNDLNKKIEDGLSVYGQIVNPGLIDNEKSALNANQLFIEENLNVLVYAPTMAAPPIYFQKSINNLNIPIMCISPQEFLATPEDYDTDAGTEHSTLVGLTMGTNILVREGIDFNVNILHVDNIPSSMELKSFFDLIKANKAIPSKDIEYKSVIEPNQSSKVIKAVDTFNKYSLIAIGDPIDGYLDVEMTNEDADILNLEIKRITKSELNDTFRSIDPKEIQNLMNDIYDNFTQSRKVDNDTLERSCRLSLTIKQLTEVHNAIGGTINCHGDLFRWNDEIGVTGCLGVSCLAEEGKLFSCTGDIPTSIALIAAKIISGSALYCECYTIDFENDTILIANGGEGDFSINFNEPNLRILPEDHYMGSNGPGVAVQFNINEMDATLISITPTYINKKREWRIILAEGRVLDSKHHNMEGPNTMFKFNTRSAVESFQDWASLGATHHAVLMPGHQKEEFKAFTDLIDIKLNIVQ